MKHTMKLLRTRNQQARQRLCAIALVVIIGFVMASCSLLGDESGSTTARLSGTYKSSYYYNTYIQFSGSDFTLYIDASSYTGTYSISDIILTLTYSWGDTEVWIITGDAYTLKDADGYLWYKQ